MTQHLRRAGAIALALAGLASGLAAAPSAHAATDASAAPLGLVGGDVPAGRFTGPFVLGSAEHAHYGVQATRDGLVATTHGDAVEAADAASPFSFPGAGTAGSITTLVDGERRCLSLGAASGSDAILADCDGSAEQTFAWRDLKNSFVSGQALVRTGDDARGVLQYAAGHGLQSGFAAIGDVYPAEALADRLVDEGDTVDQRPLVVTTPVSGDEFVAYEQLTYAGTATPGATVTVENQAFSEPAFTVDVRVDDDGHWSTTRPHGFGPYTMKVVQSMDGEVIDERTDIRLIPEGHPGADLPLTVDKASGDVFTPGRVTFSGTADGTAGNTVTLRTTNFSEPALTVTVPVTRTGTWSLERPLGNGPYAFEVVQATGDVETARLNDLKLYPEGFTPVDLGFWVDWQPTFTPGLVTLVGTGHGASGGSVTLRTINFSEPAFSVTVPVFPDGTWQLTRPMGNGPYVFEIVHTDDSGATAERVVPMEPTS